MLGILDPCDQLLESLPCGVASTGVVKFSVGVSDVPLSIGSGHVDGNIDTAVNGFRFLAVVNRNCGESFMFNGEIVLLAKPLVVDHFLFFLIKHL